LAEDEINCALDIALSVNLVTSLSEEGVLVSVETDAIIALLGIVSGECDSLGSFAIGVLNVDIVKFGISGEVIDSSASLVAGEMGTIHVTLV
jgi:hypothetical protein